MKLLLYLFLFFIFSGAISFCGQMVQAGELAWTFKEDADQWKAAKGIWEVEDGVYHQRQRWGEAIHSLWSEKPVGQTIPYKPKSESTKVTGPALFFGLKMNFSITFSYFAQRKKYRNYGFIRQVVLFLDKPSTII